MNDTFKIGFEKTAKIYRNMLDAGKKVTQRVLTGAEYRAKQIKDLTAHRMRRAGQKAAIVGSRGGTSAQAGAVRLSPNQKLLQTESKGLSRHMENSTKSLNPGSMYRKEGIGTNVIPKRKTY